MILACHFERSEQSAEGKTVTNKSETTPA